jgi:hypothetical protein
MCVLCVQVHCGIGSSPGSLSSSPAGAAQFEGLLQWLLCDHVGLWRSRNGTVSDDVADQRSMLSEQQQQQQQQQLLVTFSGRSAFCAPHNGTANDTIGPRR